MSRFMSVYTLIKREILARINRLLLSVRHGPHRKLDIQQLYFCLYGRCLKMKGERNFTDPVLSNYRRATHTDTV
jgi:hypothetical protein